MRNGTVFIGTIINKREQKPILKSSGLRDGFRLGSVVISYVFLCLTRGVYTLVKQRCVFSSIILTKKPVKFAGKAYADVCDGTA